MPWLVDRSLIYPSNVIGVAIVDLVEFSFKLVSSVNDTDILNVMQDGRSLRN